MSLRALPDVARQSKFKMVATKLEMEISLNGKRWHYDSNLYSHIFGHARHSQTLPEYRNSTATETRNGNNYWTEWSCDTIPTAAPTFATMPDSSVTLPTLPDVDYLPSFRMAATTQFWFWWSPSWISVVGRGRTLSKEPCPSRVCRKYAGRSWNRGSISHRLKVISTFG